MYAAAGGASCRNARRKQAIQLKQAEKEAAARALMEKLERKRERELLEKTKSRQFHNLPESYLRTHTIKGRKFSAGYTGHSSKLMLPSHEQSATKHRSPSHQNLHSSRHHPHLNYTGNHNSDMLRTPTHRNRSSSIMRLGVDQHQKLTKSATASFPLALMHGDPNPSSICLKDDQNHFLHVHANKPIEIQIPLADGIFITPATPIPSPSPKQPDDLEKQQQRADEAEAEDEFLNFPLERVCSVYRNRKLGFEDPTINFYDEEDERQRIHLHKKQLQMQQEQYEFYHGGMPNGQHHHTHWADEMNDDDDEAYRICDHIEVILSPDES